MTTGEYLEILAGHIFDHDMLVTYKWLSKKLQVHVNVAKQILWEFYEKHRENSNIECTHLLIGALDDSSMRIEVVKESNLSKAKEKFSKIISEHIYSVHKPLEDLELLASSDISGDVSYSAIKCDACVERNDEEMYFMRWGTTSKKIIEEKVVNSKPMESTNYSKTDKRPAAASKKNGFSNFFNTAGKQKSPETLKAYKTKKDKEFGEENNSLSKDTNLTERDKSSEKNKSPLEKSKSATENSKSKKTSPKMEETKKKKGSLDSLFGKMSSLPKSAEAKPVPEKKEDPVKEIFENKKVEEKRKPRGKKRIKSQENDNNTKKRKRIVVQNDSSDSEAQSDMDVDEPMAEAIVETEAAPTRPKSPSPPAVKHENGKRKMLKMMNETYKDDRGFIVTKKVHVYVSCSEDEEEEQKKKEERENKEEQEKKQKEKGSSRIKKAQTKVDNAKKKQTTLMKFFKAS
ncbi:DNA polymerase delta subunit 3 [Harpegnathos saltator]|uniref:DNA polymerase delta subunit 3 n=1 Tax=Harpegnathos saltator TaxID=610380 RepID=E2C149_HARSA|nr:DNA polymerase delta subunit 3 [Harpegnathos saltator]EFN78370.1 DNA polymerase delta subunit 3 [Harpegnathos saltator]